MDAVTLFPDESPCPCGSGKIVADCQCKARRFVPTPLDLRPGRLLTGIRVRKCYASALADCRPPLTADHAIARSISEDFQHEPTTRTLRDGSTRVVPTSAAGRNVLCRRHNNTLSPLDDVGRRFVRAQTEQLRHCVENSPRDAHVLFNGLDVERWMLRVLCTMAHNEPASRVYAASIWRVPQSWAQILFEERPFPPGAGMYTPRVARSRFDRGILTAKIVGTIKPAPQRGVPIVGRASPTTVLGISMCIYGLDLDLYMHPPEDKADYWYRARMYRMRSAAGGVSHLHLGWEGTPPTFKAEVAPIGRANVPDACSLTSIR